MVNLPWIWTGLFGNSFGNALDWATPLAPGVLSDCEISLTAPTSVTAGTETINSLATVSDITLSIGNNAIFTILGDPDSVIPTGNSNIAGTTTLAAGAHLNLDGVVYMSGELSTVAGSAVLVDSGLFNNGTVNQSGAVTLGDSTHAGEIQNSAGDTWSISGSSAAILKGSSVAGTFFINEGLLLHSSGASHIDVATRNTGQINTVGGELDFLGGVNNSGTMSVASGVLSLAGVNGTGTIDIEGSGQLTIVSGASLGQTVDFNSASSGTETLNLGRALTFAGHIAGFAATDVIDLQHVTATTESFTGGVLTLKNHGVTVASLHFDGSDYSTSHFALASDGHAGTTIRYT